MKNLPQNKKKLKKLWKPTILVSSSNHSSRLNCDGSSPVLLICSSSSSGTSGGSGSASSSAIGYYNPLAAQYDPDLDAMYDSPPIPPKPPAEERSASVGSPSKFDFIYFHYLFTQYRHTCNVL